MTTGDGPLGWLSEALADLDRDDLRRTLRHHASTSGTWLDLDTPTGLRRVLHLCGNSYLGLADDERVVNAAVRATREFGVGAGASRLVSGGSVLHQALEAELAAWKGREAALLVSSGYLANLAVVTALVGRGDTVVSDQRNHASIIDACRLSGADVRVYRHAEPEHAEALLRDAPGRRLLITDGVFSMDGDLAPLPALCDVAERHGAAVVVDDAHGSGVIGEDGRGTAALLGCEDRVHAIVVTLSKALGSAGGAVIGDQALIEWLRNRARPFIFDTAPPASTVAAARAALAVSRIEPWRRERAVEHAGTLAATARAAGFDSPSPRTCIVPVIIGENAPTMQAMERLLDLDVLAVAIRPPSVAPGGARLRLTSMATHIEQDMLMAIDALQEALALASPTGNR